METKDVQEPRSRTEELELAYRWVQEYIKQGGQLRQDAPAKKWK